MFKKRRICCSKQFTAKDMVRETDLFNPAMMFKCGVHRFEGGIDPLEHGNDVGEKNYD